MNSPKSARLRTEAASGRSIYLLAVAFDYLIIGVLVGALLLWESAQTGPMWLSLSVHFAAFLLVSILVHLAARHVYGHIAGLARTAAERERLIDESEARYGSVIESVHDGIAIVHDDRFVFANARLAELFEMPVDKIVGTVWLDFIHESDREKARQHRVRQMQGERLPHEFHVRLGRVVAGSPSIVVDMQIIPLKKNAAAGDDRTWVLNLKNITDRLRAEREWRLATAAFQSTSEAIMVTDQSAHIVTVNPAFTRITGYTLEEATGRTPNLLNSGHHDKEFFIALWRTLRESGHWAGEIWNRRKDGRLYVEWLSITAVRGDDEADGGGECSYVGTFSDITKRKEAEDMLRHRASHDILTDLPNRGLFDDRLQLAISQARRYQRNFALLYIDLDRFKDVNDMLGHAAGDELLVMAAQRMADCIRESDTLSRFGGDEFAAILSDVSGLGEVEEVAGRMVATLARPFQMSCGSANISGSVGIAIYPDHGTGADELKRSADAALYHVKENARNAYRLYSSDMKKGAAPVE